MKLLKMNLPISTKIKAGISLFITLLFVITVFLKTGCYFETNDDRTFVEILSGTFTGSPDAHTIFINYILSSILAFLYSLLPQIPWYGFFLLCAQGFSLFLLTYALLRKTKSIQELFAVSCVCFALLSSNLYLLASIQFTSVSAILAIAGYAYLLTGNGKTQEWLLFFLLELLSFMLREDAMLMIQPYGFSLFLVGLIIKKHSFDTIKAAARHLFTICITFLFIFVISALGNYIGYHSSDWKEYKSYNEYRSLLFDYYGLPAYDEVKDILARYEVTETEYNAFSLYIVLDEDINGDCLKELSLYVESQNKKSFSLIRIIKEIVDNFTSHNQLMGNFRLITLWCAAILGCIITGKYPYLLHLSALAFVRNIIWGYIIYRGRMPYRITLPLIYMELVMLLLLCLDIYRSTNRKICYIAAALFCSCFIFFSYTTLQAQYRHCTSTNHAKEVLSSGYLQVIEYCRSHPENHYILEEHSFSSCSPSVLDTRSFGMANHMHSGGWYSTSPLATQRINNYLGIWQNEMYLIVYDGQNDEGYLREIWQYATIYLTEKTNRTPVLADYLSLPSGGNFFVWKF